MRGTVAISLQQPTPEVYGLFDEVGHLHICVLSPPVCSTDSKPSKPKLTHCT